MITDSCDNVFLLFLLVTAKDGSKNRHTFTHNSVSPRFTDFLAGVSTQEDSTSNDWQILQVDQEVKMIFSESCMLPSRNSFKGAAMIFYELGKVRVRMAQN